MRTFVDAKAMAKTLRGALEERNMAITHSEALEIVAAQFGLADWNTLAARIPAAPSPGGAPRFFETCPILRIFDEEKAKEFYSGFLGFTVDWEHRFGDNFPLYAQVSRAGLRLHLSGHHGDATPGATMFVAMQGIRAFHKELNDKHYRHNKPGLETEDWGLNMEVTDPFNNRIRFCERPSGA